MNSLCIRDAQSTDRREILDLLNERWGGETIVVRQTVFHPADLPSAVAVDGTQLVGLVTYMIEPQSCEIITLDSLVEGKLIGTALLNRVETVACANQCLRVTAVTTNDNLDALRFYQRRGYRITAIDAEAVCRSRALKPSIPEFGQFGIPIRDELTLTKQLDGAGTSRTGKTRW